MHFRLMQNYGNERQGHKSVEECCNMAVVGRAKRWNHCRGRRALDWTCIGDETSSQAVPCREDFCEEYWLAKLLTRICKHAERLDAKLYLGCLVVSLWLDNIWSVGRHKYWAHECYFELKARINRRLTETFTR